MVFQSALQAASVLAMGVSASALAIFLSARLWPAGGNGPDQGKPGDAVFLLNDDVLLDANAAGRLLIAGATGGATGGVTGGAGATGRAHVIAALCPRFPALARVLDDLPRRKAVDIGSADGRARIEAEWTDGHTRLRLVRAGDPEDLAPMDGHALSGLLAELDDLRCIADHLPLPVWQVSPRGDVTWANAAYLAISAGDTGDGQALPRLVGDALSVAAPGAGALALTPPDGGRTVNYRWQSHAAPGGLVFAAWPEGSGTSALGGFLDTLANTFAQLSVGLAVFDKGKRLTLFNPAFSDLTGLQAAFLVSRPTIEQLLDRLRDDRMAPEPKDYRAWRRALSDIDPQDGNGAHTELWPLADGRTFRTTVRPQEGGALAFLLEDVTQVLAVSRRLRAELEISQAVMDALEDAVAVFSPDGVMTVSNRAYAALWGADPLAHVGDDLTLVDAVEHWQRCCVPTPVWGDARAFALDLASRPDWTVEVRTRDDRPLICRFRQIAGRATLASFSERVPSPANTGIKRQSAQSA